MKQKLLKVKRKAVSYSFKNATFMPELITLNIPIKSYLKKYLRCNFQNLKNK
jgi:hypothetical protein